MFDTPSVSFFKRFSPNFASHINRRFFLVFSGVGYKMERLVVNRLISDPVVSILDEREHEFLF